jgi:uncharacterized protein
MAVSKTVNARVWQRMLSGRRLDLIDPSPVDIEIIDIAHGLARLARWNGQTAGAHVFSVAQHSLLVLDIASRLRPDLSAHEQMLTLLHDSPEYVIGDMISPFKSIIGHDYKAIEERLLGAIHLRFGLPPLTPASTRNRIKRADRIAAFLEATRLAGFQSAEAIKFFGRPDTTSHDPELLSPKAPEHAQRLFLDAFERIEQARQRE